MSLSNKFSKPKLLMTSLLLIRTFCLLSKQELC